MYKIANLTIEIRNHEKNLERLAPFKINGSTKPDMVITARQKLIWNFKRRENQIDDLDWFPVKEDGIYNADLYSYGVRKGSLVINQKTNEGSIQYKSTLTGFDYTIPEFLAGVIFRTLLFNYNGFVFHSSAIKYNNHGIIFTAPSGTGKSTHCALWEKHRNAEIINDDTPAIRLTEDGVLVYGTPWSGSSRKFANESVPLKAIVVIEQSPTNEMTKIPVIEAVMKIMPRVFLPYHDEKLMDRALAIVENVLQIVPVYLLKCTPEVEAMELVEKCLEL